MDFGASAHVTPDLNALTSYIQYDGSELLRVDDGKDLDITYIDNASLSTESSSLLLTNMLHVSSISKPLISISQLAIESNKS
jgi:hypothetical protein